MNLKFFKSQAKDSKLERIRRLFCFCLNFTFFSQKLFQKQEPFVSDCFNYNFSTTTTWQSPISPLNWHISVFLLPTVSPFQSSSAILSLPLSLCTNHSIVWYYMVKSSKFCNVKLRFNIGSTQKSHFYFIVERVFFI
jgi:hypothetical protein